MSMRIGLVSCVKSKLDHRAPARDLYTSQLFTGAREVVEVTCDRWFILSALHGVVHPDRELEPYELTLNDASVRERREWAEETFMQLEPRLHAGDVVEVHAGRNYMGFGLEERLRRMGVRVHDPLAGLGIGKRLAWYSARRENPNLLRFPEHDPASDKRRNIVAARTKKTSSTRSGAKAKAKATGKSAAEKRAEEKAKKDAAAKREAEAKAKAEAKDKARKEKEEAKAKERQDLIDSGALIEDGDAEYRAVEDRKVGKLEKDAIDALETLKKSKVPILKQELVGSSITATGMFAMLKAQGLVREYRKRTGERGGSGVAYLWIG